jgi:cyclopropane-fatty-acyl-phospholipid synthase
MLRTAFERMILPHWRGAGIRIRYWDGREITAGSAPHDVTLHVNSPSVLRGMLRNPSLGFGHAYQDGRLDIEGDLQSFLRAAFALAANGAAWQPPRFLRWAPQTTRPTDAEANARFHYDRGNDFFRLWLDPSMTYSCAYFRTENDSLEKAQEQKRELLCKKLDLEKDQSLLDIGCGWGSVLFHAIEHYGVRGVGITPSHEQAKYIEAEAERRGLADNLELHIADWRAVSGTYDRVVSVGMYEHVGKADAPAFFRKWHEWLKPDGVSVLHTIGVMDSQPPDPWIAENIFPGGYLPSLAELAAHAADAGLVVADVENLWRHYVLTLAAWCRNFDAAREKITAMTNERFTRTWWLYLNASQAAFAAGRLLLWQLVLTRGKRMKHPLTRESWVP